MYVGRLLVLLSILTASTASQLPCLEAVACGPGEGSCHASADHSVSRVCFTRSTPAMCKQYSICPAQNATVDLHLSLRFSTALLSAPCRLWLSNATGRWQYNLAADSPGGTGMYLRATLGGGNITITYSCNGTVPEAASEGGSPRLDIEFYLDPRSKPLCGIANAGYGCDNGGCVPLLWRCNGLAECSDGYDEYGCPTIAANEQRTTALLPPSRGSVSCGASGCSPINKPDCTDSDSDSPLCGGSSSTESPGASSSASCGTRNATFRCSESGVCVPAAWRCDQSLDCSDGSDENDCDGTSVRVITAAVIGSLVCSILVVIAAGCTCKLYALRTLHERRHHRRSRRYEMTAFQTELLRRRAPPPSYEAAMRPVAEAVTPAVVEQLTSAVQQRQPLDAVQRELLAHIEAVATAVRAQHGRHHQHHHHHHHRHHHYQRPQPAAEGDFGDGGAVAIAMPPEMTASSSVTERWLCQQQQHQRSLATDCVVGGGSSTSTSDPSSAAAPRLIAASSSDADRAAAVASTQPDLRQPRADIPGWVRAGRSSDAAAAAGSAAAPVAVGAAAQPSSSSSLAAGLSACGRDGGEYERARAAAVREQLDQFLPSLPSFRCGAGSGRRGSASTTVDNVRITASLTASYERTSAGCSGSSSAAGGGSSSAANALKKTTTSVSWARGGRQQQQQRATYNVAFVASDSDDEPLLFAGGSGDSDESSSSSTASTPASDVLAAAVGFATTGSGTGSGGRAAAAPAAAAAAAAAAVLPLAAATGYSLAAAAAAPSSSPHRAAAAAEPVTSAAARAAATSDDACSADVSVAASADSADACACGAGEQETVAAPPMGDHSPCATVRGSL